MSAARPVRDLWALCGVKLHLGHTTPSAGPGGPSVRWGVGARLAGGSALLVAGLVLAGCGPAVHDLAFPVPAPTAASTSTTTALANPSVVGEAVVAGATSTRGVALGPGRATISGVVDGPGGPVGGATVQIQRLVGDRSASIEVQSSPDGAFRLTRVLGGRYRVRAWQSPTLAMITAQVFFVGNGATQRLTLVPAAFVGPTVTSSFAPDPTTAGRPTTVVVEVTTPTVSAAGVVQYKPAVARRVTLVGAGFWKVQGTGRALTDVHGEASFVAACGPAGDDPLTAIVERTVPVSLATPLCVAAPSPTTTAAPTTTTTTVGSSTTSTVPKGHGRSPASTTTTTGT